MKQVYQKKTIKGKQQRKEIKWCWKIYKNLEENYLIYGEKYNGNERKNNEKMKPKIKQKNADKEKEWPRVKII